LQFEAAWVLTNIGSGDTISLVEAGAVPPLIDLLHSPDLNVVEQAAWALGNIAGESVDYRDLVLASGALPILSAIEVVCFPILTITHLRLLTPKSSLQSTPRSVLQTVTWTISNLCRGTPAPPVDVVQVVFPSLLQRLIGDDDEAKSYACWALSYLCYEDTSSLIDTILKMGCLQPIVTIFETATDATLQTASFRVVANILSGDEAHTQRVLDCAILPIFLRHLIRSSNLELKTEICHVLLNIMRSCTRSCPELLQTVIDSRILEKIVSLIRDVPGTPEELLHDCVLCLVNATRLATEAQMNYLNQLKVLPMLLSRVSTSFDGHLVDVLEGIENIIRKEPKAIEGIDDRCLESILRVASLAGEAGERAKRILQLIPSRLAV
jgi:importin subunit alpha-6/7